MYINLCFMCFILPLKQLYNKSQAPSARSYPNELNTPLLIFCPFCLKIALKPTCTVFCLNLEKWGGVGVNIIATLIECFLFLPVSCWQGSPSLPVPFK
uniref:Uncharacterized protein n=1 Tax=Pyxicephalus adspersus TaxID=30357 RepID=A0AAV3A9L1_PYXAD|nr:TPA: hypothetical protein GDO54_012026 [Pyxicephalus adspersus]